MAVRAYVSAMRRACLAMVVGLHVGCLPNPSTVADFCAPPIGGSPVRGPEEAWVTMVEFADFECLYCGRVEATLGELFTIYPQDLRLAFKYLPLPAHPHAMAAAVAAECAHAQGLFWEMHDQLFAHQEALTDLDLERYAAAVSVDLGTWAECLASPSPGEIIAGDQAQARRGGVSGTPTFFINGAVIEGAAPTGDFREVIDKELAAAEASGVPREQYYAQLEESDCK
jgi:protein-disulfide isomerase